MLRTTEQRKAICTTCPMARAADCVGDSTTLLIVRDLLTGPKRYGELEESLRGISTRTLANKLKSLEQNGIVLKREYKERPPRTAYVLTPKGKGLSQVEKALRAYGKKYL